jgi:manganese/iron transport system permease protein
MQIWQWLTEPLTLEFMRTALIAGGLAGIVCPVIGCFLIVQRMSLLGDVMTHTVMPGMAIAFFMRIDVAIGAFISGVGSAFLIAMLRSQTRIKIDAAMAMTSSSFLAIGILLISLLKVKIDLHGFLFGDILSVTQSDTWRSAIITAIVLMAIAIFYKPLLFYTFDPIGAKAIGLPVNLIYLGLMSAVALTIIASMQTMGVVLVISLLIGPAITAYLLVKELHQMIFTASITGVLASNIGLYVSYYLNLPSGPTIVIAILLLFFLALIFSPSQGLITNKLKS